MSTQRFAVLGTRKEGQGIAAAYDLAKFGNTTEVIVVDKDAVAATEAAHELNRLLPDKIFLPTTLDATDLNAVRGMLCGVDGFVSAMHFDLNLALTELAIEMRCHMVDLGGNTAVVRNQHKLDKHAKVAGVRIIPDCGMAPGFDVNLACYALRKIKHPESVVIYCGGIPEKPLPPLWYHFPFSVKGLVNECSGYADIIEHGRLAKHPCLDTIEEVLVPNIGMLEATYTSGGLSTAPWTLHRRYPMLERLEYKTLRYPGHWRILQELMRAGNLEHGLVSLAETTPHDLMDLGIIQVRCEGSGDTGQKITVIIDVLDTHDQKTKFTAMQRLTGFHASIALIAATETMKCSGVRGVESIDPRLIVREFARRGITVNETVAKHG